MNVKRLTPAEAAKAVRLVKRFADKDVSLAYMHRFLANPANYVVVAQIDSEIVGFVLAFALDYLKADTHKLFIYEIEVAASHRRQGVGRALINFVRGVVARENMLNAFVLTNYANQGAMQFYQNTGGQIANGDDVMFVYDEQ